MLEGILAALVFLLVLWLTSEVNSVDAKVDDYRRETAERLESLEAAVSEGLAMAVEESAAKLSDQDVMNARAVAICSQNDAMVVQVSPTRAVAMSTKVGQC